jgi:WD40 repeat protein
LAVLAPAAIIGVLLVSGANVRRERNQARQQEHRANTATARAEAETRQATAAREQTHQNLYAADMLLAQHALDDGNLGLARRLVEVYRPIQNPADLRGFEWRYLWKQCQGDQLHTLSGHSNGVFAVAFSRDGKVLASGDRAGNVKLWDIATRRPLDALVAGRRVILRVSFSADGQALATADESGWVNVWNLATRQAWLTRQGRNPTGVKLSPTNPWIGFTEGTESRGIPMTNAVAHVVDWITGKEMLPPVTNMDFEAFSPDGKLAYLIGDRPNRAELWDLAAGRRIKTIPNLNVWIFPSPDGRFTAGLPYWQTEVTLVDLAGKTPPTWLRLGSAAVSLAFSPDSTLLACAMSDQTVRAWNVADQREVARLRGHVNEVTGVAFSPDGQLLATSSADHTVMLWPVAWQKNSEIISNVWPPYLLSPDGKTLAGFDRSHGAKKIVVWDTATHQATALSRPGEPLVPECFSPDSQTLVARAEPTPEGFLPLLRWNLKTPAGPPKTTLLPLQNTNAVFGTVSALDAPLYALQQIGNRTITLWNPLNGDAAGQLRKLQLGRPWKLSPDGRKLVTLGSMFQFTLTDLATPDRSASAQLPVGSVRGMAFSLDGEFLAIGCSDHTIRLFDTAHCKEAGVLSGHQQGVEDVAFSPDGRTLASCGVGGVVKLWSWPARREVATLMRGSSDFVFVAFARDNNTLLAADAIGRLHFFRAPTLAETDRELER